MKSCLVLSLFALAVSVTPAFAVVYNLVAPSEPVPVGAEVKLNLLVLNPGEEENIVTLSDVLAARLSSDTQAWPLELTALAMDGPFNLAAGGFAVRVFLLKLPEKAKGRLVLEISDPAASKVVIEAQPKLDEDVKVVAPLSNFAPQRTVDVAVKRAFVGRFTAHEPTYFAMGDELQAARFQFSFKYRMIGEEAKTNENLSAIRALHFGYTQRSLWDITAESSPFYDSSYMPELIYESRAVLDSKPHGGPKWLGYQVGLRHESNGQTGLTSRSMNTMYFRPGFALGRLDDWNIIVSPRASLYVGNLSNNPDIKDYRGNFELMAVVGRNDGPSLSLISRLGRDGNKGSLQADLNIPIKFERVFDFATYFLVQYWNGYGESLLDYDKQTRSLRFGFSLVR